MNASQIITANKTLKPIKKVLGHNVDHRTGPESVIQRNDTRGGGRGGSTRGSIESENPPATINSPNLSDCAAIQLLAEDVEEKLESLLKTFVTEDKLRQEARLNLLNKRSASLTNLNAFDPGGGGSPQERTNYRTVQSSNQSNQRQSTNQGRSLSSATGRASSFIVQRSPSPSSSQSSSSSLSQLSQTSPSLQRSSSSSQNIYSPSSPTTSSSSTLSTSSSATSKKSPSSVSTLGSNTTTTNTSKQGNRKIANKNENHTRSTANNSSTNISLVPEADKVKIRNTESAGSSMGIKTNSSTGYGKDFVQGGRGRLTGSPLSSSSSLGGHYSGPGSKLKQARSQEDLRLSAEVERLLSGLTDWSPKSRYIQLIAEKSGLLPDKKKSTSSSRLSSSSLGSKSDLSSSTRSNGPSKGPSESGGRLSRSSIHGKDGSTLRSASRSPERVPKLPVISNSDVKDQSKSTQKLIGSKVSQSTGRTSSPSSLTHNQNNTSKEMTINSSPSSTRGTTIAPNNQKVISKTPTRETKSMEQILADALKLTEDETATLVATRENSLATKLAKQRAEESKGSPILKDSSSSLLTIDGKSSQSNSLNSEGTKCSEMKTPKEGKKEKEDDGRFKDSLFSSPVNYAKSRFAASKEANENTSDLDNLNGSNCRQSMVNEAKQAWEQKASKQSSDKPIYVRGSSAFSNPWYSTKSNEVKPTTSPSNTNGLNGSPKPSTTIHRTNPVRPFLTKGSVAERVLLFERRPELKKESRSSLSEANKSKSPVLYNTWRNQDKTQSDVSQIAQNFIQPVSSISRRPSINSVRNSWGSSYSIPKFYFPSGRPYSAIEVDARIRRIVEEFNRLPECSSSRENFGRITKAAGLPLYWKQAIFNAANGDARNPIITCDQFVKYFKDLVLSCHDDASKFVRIYSQGKRSYLLPEDFIAMMQDVIETHPGLGFLKEATEFHSRYVHTVIARIFYCVNKSWSGRITIPELKKSNFLLVVSLLEEEDDINQITDYFSYEHFYVIYCKFWELDKDHDLIIDKEDLMRHNDAAISSRMIDRIFSGAVTRGPVRRQGKMTYAEFVWFLISEEDKKHPRAVEYWFRCMDIDGDGFLSMYELEYFYEEQVKRMEALGIEALPFNDCLCQMLDMVRPKEIGRIALADLKRCRMTPVFFDTFFNLDKYLDHEQRDPFSSKDNDDNIISDWDRFAAEEYELLVAEESAQQARSR